MVPAESSSTMAADIHAGNKHDRGIKSAGHLRRTKAGDRLQSRVVRPSSFAVEMMPEAHPARPWQAAEGRRILT